MVPVAAASALLYAVLALGRTPSRVPDHLAQPLTAALVLLVIANSVVHLVLVAQPRQSTNVMLVVVGAGAVLLSMRWLLATLYLAWGAWAVAAFIVGSADSWPHYVVGLVSATVSRSSSTTCAGRACATSAVGRRPRRPRYATT